MNDARQDLAFFSTFNLLEKKILLSTFVLMLKIIQVAGRRGEMGMSLL
jgi:hypothetical protein